MLRSSFSEGKKAGCYGKVGGNDKERKMKELKFNGLHSSRVRGFREKARKYIAREEQYWLLGNSGTFFLKSFVKSLF